MGKVQILVDESELAKLDNYTIVEREHPLMSFFGGYTDFSEISSCDQLDIIKTAERAIEEDAVGITVNIESGRDCRDRRCYTYMNSAVTDGKYPDYKVSDMLEHLKGMGEI